MAKEGEPKSFLKETVAKVGIAGGIVAGFLGLLSRSADLFVLAAVSLGGGLYLKNKK